MTSVDAFIADRCHLAPGAVGSLRDLFAAYQVFCQQQRIPRVCVDDFYRALVASGYRSAGRNSLAGIRLQGNQE